MTDMKRILMAAVPMLLLLAACTKGPDPVISLSKSDIEASCNAKDIYIPLSANIDYDVNIQGDANLWLSVASKLSNELVIRMAANTTSNERVGKVDLTYNGNTLKTITITQAEAEPQLIYAAPENKNFIRMAYFPYYRNNTAYYMPDDYLKTVDVAAYAFAHINDKYKVYLENGSGEISTLVSRCHSLGIKVVLSFAGEAKYYKEMVKKGSTRKIFIDSVMEIVNKYNLDGVDNDWEWPSSKDHTKQGNLLLMREFSNILHAPGVNKMLTMAITSGKYAGGYQQGIDPGVYDCCDFFGVMIYDDSDPHSPFELMTTAYNWWVGTAKMPPYKFVGGIPAYSRGSGKYKAYNTLVLTDGADPDADSHTVDGITYYYNGRKMVEKKVTYLYSEKKVGGYFFWEAGEDTTDDKSLLRHADATLKALQAAESD